MENCLSCESRLFGLVRYCPFCGDPTASTKEEDAKAAPPATVPHAQAASEMDEAAAGNVAQLGTAAPEPAGAPVSTPVAAAPEASAGVTLEVSPMRPARERKRAVKPGKPVTEAYVGTASQAGAITEPLRGKGHKQRLSAKQTAILIAIAACIVLYLKSGGNTETKDDAGCDQAFAAGINAIAVGDMVNARSQLTRTSAICKGDRASRPAALQAALAKEESQRDDCDRRIREVGAYMDEHKLVSVRTGLQNLSSACAANLEVADLRKRLSQQQNAASEARNDARKRLDEHDTVGAKIALDKLAGANSEDPELQSMLGELDKPAQEAREVPAPEPAAHPEAPVEVPLSRESSVPIIKVPPQPAPIRRPEQSAEVRMQTEMAQGLLRDAERALAQRQFDAARTYVESARRVDPNNARLDSMAQQIRERERQILQQETSIK